MNGSVRSERGGSTRLPAADNNTYDRHMLVLRTNVFREAPPGAHHRGAAVDRLFGQFSDPASPWSLLDRFPQVTRAEAQPVYIEAYSVKLSSSARRGSAMRENEWPQTDANEPRVHSCKDDEAHSNGGVVEQQCPDESSRRNALWVARATSCSRSEESGSTGTRAELSSHDSLLEPAQSRRPHETSIAKRQANLPMDGRNVLRNRFE